MGHHRSIFNSYTGAADNPVSLASREGRFARATGQAASLNPYLGIAANKEDLSDAQHAEWVLCCRAWWRGWEDEEALRAPHQSARHSPGAALAPKLSDWPLEHVASLAERSALAFRLGSRRRTLASRSSK